MANIPLSGINRKFHPSVTEMKTLTDMSVVEGTTTEKQAETNGKSDSTSNKIKSFWNDLKPDIFKSKTERQVKTNDTSGIISRKLTWLVDKTRYISKAATDALSSTDDKSQQHDMYPKIPRGLPNIGSTCFMNSVLQCLIWTPTLPGKLKLQMAEMKEVEKRHLNKETKLENHSTNQLVITERLHDLVIEACNKPFLGFLGLGLSENYVHRMLNGLRKRNSQFTGFTQQDSFECFNTIISGIEEERMALLGNEADGYADSCPVGNLFEGKFLSVYEYSACDFTDFVLQRFTAISVPVSDEEPFEKNRRILKHKPSKRILADKRQKKGKKKRNHAKLERKRTLRHLFCLKQNSSTTSKNPIINSKRTLFLSIKRTTDSGVVTRSLNGLIDRSSAVKETDSSKDLTYKPNRPIKGPKVKNEKDSCPVANLFEGKFLSMYQYFACDNELFEKNRRILKHKPIKRLHADKRQKKGENNRNHAKLERKRTLRHEFCLKQNSSTTSKNPIVNSKGAIFLSSRRTTHSGVVTRSLNGQMECSLSGTETDSSKNLTYKSKTPIKGSKMKNEKRKPSIEFNKYYSLVESKRIKVTEKMQTLIHDSLPENGIEKGLKELIQVERFSDTELPCPVCKKGNGGHCFKTLLIVSPPPILVLQINRFKPEGISGQLKKIQADIDYPEILDLSKFVSRGIKATHSHIKAVQYSLYGVICHWGTLHGGHYYAYVKNTSVEKVSKLQTFLDEQILESDLLADIRNFLDPQDGINIGSEDDEIKTHKLGGNGTTHSEENENTLQSQVKREHENHGSQRKCEWYYISDSCVRKIPRAPKDGKAYILMYERIQ